QKLAELVQECGAIIIIPQKTRLCFQARVRFINLVVRKSYMLCEFGFPARNENPRFDKIVQYGPRWYGHRCKVASGQEFDDEFKRWIRLAYEVGQQMHLL